ncbi:hypothetical protein [Synechococcus sp. UW140]|uniref:hypothetical protein n=1 Tax=Synechococcus sp. UW140 TaxID=368503 RepID=UPI0025FBEE73|nr:hypothetical protein [Synechococcus sp. UW140]
MNFPFCSAAAGFRQVPIGLVQNKSCITITLPLVATRPPDPQDPEYQQLERWVNFGVHGALFSFVNSGLWLWHGLRPGSLQPLPQLSLVWLVLLLLHLVWCYKKSAKPA